ncbi:MAG TPA: hypothetical protein VES97_00310 [Solirubrobacteraceae bacterium]|nr:hypothetical protein [Solirubrobacteraceae bacterium]
MTTLREVIEHMFTFGYNTPAKIVEVSKQLKDDVPVLREAEQKGNFEKRMDRAAITVLADRIGKSPDVEAPFH